MTSGMPLLLIVLGLLPSPDNSPKDNLKRAQNAIDKGDYATAIALFDEVLRADPKNGSARLGRARARWAIAAFEPNKLTEAIRDLDEVIHLEPRNAVAYN